MLGTSLSPSGRNFFRGRIPLAAPEFSQQASWYSVPVFWARHRLPTGKSGDMGLRKWRLNRPFWARYSFLFILTKKGGNCQRNTPFSGGEKQILLRWVPGWDGSWALLDHQDRTQWTDLHAVDSSRDGLCCDRKNFPKRGKDACGKCGCKAAIKAKAPTAACALRFLVGVPEVIPHPT